ncbi:MAG: beta-ribofuranosylaminobenzene 5'-phosphate synthase family protein, partial [Geminicoccaceae bacterium]
MAEHVSDRVEPGASHRARHRGAVTVCAPARLHLGFLDLHGGLGRRFGSIGLTLEDIATRLRATPAGETQA